jgi:hypothetical protein
MRAEHVELVLGLSSMIVIIFTTAIASFVTGYQMAARTKEKQHAQNQELRRDL